MTDPKEIQAPAVSLKYIAKYIAWSVKEMSENVKKITLLAEEILAAPMRQSSEHGSQTHFQGSSNDPIPF